MRYDDTNAINLTKNLIQHSKTKHIDIRYYFIRDHMQNNDIVLDFIGIDNQLVNIFTKPLNKDQMNFIKSELDMLNAL